jgi:hypothetical protein
VANIILWRGKIHPIVDLIEKAEELKLFEQEAWTRRMMNRTIITAKAEYAERYGDQHYGRETPEGWDEWFDYYRDQDRCTGDQFSEMYNSLRIWSTLSGEKIRLMMHQLTEQRIEGLGRVRIKGGVVVRWEELGERTRGSDSTLRRQVEDMLREMMEKDNISLPDVDLVINGLQEARVIPPFETVKSATLAMRKGRGEPSLTLRGCDVI